MKSVTYNQKNLLAKYLNVEYNTCLEVLYHFCIAEKPSFDIFPDKTSEM